MAVIKFPEFKRNQTFEYLDPDSDNDEYEEGYSDTDDFIDEGTDDARNGMTGEQAADYRKARLRALRKAARRVLVCALALGALAALVFYQSQNGTYSRATYTTIVEGSSSNGTQYVMLGSRIVSYSRDGASCMTMDGTQVYSVTYEMQQPLTAQNGDILALADVNGSEITILSDSKVLGTVNTSLPIRQISVSENGEVAAVMDDQDTTWIYLYNTSGETIAYFKTTMGQSGYPLGIAISPDGSLVAVSHLVVSDDGADTSIAFYNFGGVGANSVENNVSGFNYNNEIYPYIRFMNDDTCVAVSDTRVAFFTGSEIPQSGTNIMWPSQAIGVWSNAKYLAVLFQDTSGEGQYNMKVYGTSGSVVGDFVFTMDYSAVQLAGDRIYINNAQECMIYTVNGTRKYDGVFGEDVRSFIPSSKSRTRHAVVTDEGLCEMRLE